MTLPAPTVTPPQARRFHDEGWFVIHRALAPTELETLRSECQRLVAERDAEMTRLGVDALDLCHRGRRYFLHAYTTSPAVREFLRSDLMVDIARAVLGEHVYLFNEQYVIKAAERGMPFAWHQDSGFIPIRTRPTSPAGSRSTTSAKPTAPCTCSPTPTPAPATSSPTIVIPRPTT